MLRELVKPLDQVAHTTRCSILDPMLMYVTSSIAFCYRERLDPARLQHALARVLSDYGGYAGRLRRESGHWSIEHGTGGTRFEVVDNSQSSAALGAAALARDSRDVCPRISALGVLRGHEPLFAARVTRTADGTVIGVTANHALGDAYSTMLLLRAWALAYRGQPYERPFDVADRGAYLREQLPKPAAEPTHWRLLSWSECWRCYAYHLWSTRPKRRLVLEFSASDVMAIHATVAQEPSVTTHDALCAHVFMTLRRLLEAEVGSRFGLAINYRSRLGLPANLLGNMSDVVVATANERSDTATIASAFRAGIRAVGTGPMSYPDLEKFKAAHSSIFEQMRYWNTFCDPFRINLILTNVAGLKYYDLVFGDTRPVFVHARAMDQDAVGLGTVLNTPDGGGATVDLVLPSKWVARVEHDHHRSPLAVLRDNESKRSADVADTTPGRAATANMALSWRQNGRSQSPGIS